MTAIAIIFYILGYILFGYSVTQEKDLKKLTMLLLAVVWPVFVAIIVVLAIAELAIFDRYWWKVFKDIWFCYISFRWKKEKDEWTLDDWKRVVEIVKRPEFLKRRVIYLKEKGKI